MEQLPYDLTGTIRLVLPITLTILFGTMAALSFLGSTFKQALLSQDRDGRRLLMLGVGAVILAVMAKTGTNTVALATFGATLVVFGGAIWTNDRLTDALLNPAFGGVYLVVAAANFGYGAFWGTETIAFNAIGLTQLVVPVGLGVLFGSLAVFALLSEQFKQRVLPQNTDGGRLMGLGAAFLVVALFSSNPVMLVAAITFSATLVVLGGLVYVKDTITNFLLKTWMAPMYLLFAVALFARAADFFTSAVVTSVLLILLSGGQFVRGFVASLQSTVTKKPTVEPLGLSMVYFIAGITVFVLAIIDLLIK